MQRDSKTYELSSVAKSKTYKLVYSKRVLNPDTLLTYPYGYVQDEEPLPQCTLTWFANTDFMWEAPQQPIPLNRSAMTLLTRLENTAFTPDASGETLHTVTNMWTSLQQTSCKPPFDSPVTPKFLQPESQILLLLGAFSISMPKDRVRGCCLKFFAFCPKQASSPESSKWSSSLDVGHRISSSSSSFFSKDWQSKSNHEQSLIRQPWW